MWFNPGLNLSTERGDVLLIIHLWQPDTGSGHFLLIIIIINYKYVKRHKQYLFLSYLLDELVSCRTWALTQTVTIVRHVRKLQSKMYASIHSIFKCLLIIYISWNITCVLSVLTVKFQEPIWSKQKWIRKHF